MVHALPPLPAWAPDTNLVQPFRFGDVIACLSAQRFRLTRAERATISPSEGTRRHARAGRRASGAAG